MEGFVTVHTHTNHYADWCGASIAMGPKRLSLAAGDFTWTAAVAIHTLVHVKQVKSGVGVNCNKVSGFILAQKTNISNS